MPLFRRDMSHRPARVVAGLAIAIVLGTRLALLSGLRSRGENAIDSPLQMIRTRSHFTIRTHNDAAPRR